MGDYKKDDRRRRSRSPDYTEVADIDFQYAMKLSAELNGDLGGHAEAAATAAKRQAGYENDFDTAVQMQFGDETETKSDAHPSSNGSSTSAASLTALRPEGAGSSEATIVEPDSSAGGTLRSLSDFRDYIKASVCAQCGERFFKCESDVSKLFQDWYEGKGEEREGGRSGGEQVTITTEGRKQGEGKGENWPPAQHSGIGYGGNNEYSSFLPSMGLDDSDEDDFDDDDFDDDDFDVHPSKYSHIFNKSVKKKSEWKATGTGRTISDHKSQAYEAQQAMDSLGATIFNLLQHLLPSLERGHSFDMDPPAMIAEMLLESMLLEYCSELLSNDSLEDAVLRKATYDALLDFVKVITMYYTSANPTFFSGRPEMCNLLTQTYRHVEPTPRATASSIADSLRELSKLSNLLLKDAEYHKTIYNAGNDRDLLSLCRKISDLWKSLSVHILNPGSEASRNTSTASSAEVAAVSDVSDDQICTSHAFATQARAQFRSPPGRFKRLVSEVNILKTSLPPNIFVRHGESRLDVLKCVITGPEDTPYENGIFEFDMYCPTEYPNVPPLVSFKTTGGGVHGMNPNLYADGKVCLSLLGTWSGQPWKPGESTLLQVLVSLQAMVFCEQPWYNEPGRERSYGSGAANSAAEAYNRRIRELTVRLGMLGWLEKASPMWQDIVEQHFKSNADKILRTVIEWSKKYSPSQFAMPHELPDLPGFDDYGGHEIGYRAALPQLHRHLQKYDATVPLPEICEGDPEPQAKKARVEGSQGEKSQDPALTPDPKSLSSYYGLDEVDGLEADSDMAYYNDMSAPLGGLPGGYRGRGAHHSGYSFRGRGQVFGAGPGDPAQGPTPPGGSDGGRGRGQGRGFHTWLARGRGRGRGAPDPFDPFPSVQELKYGKGRRLGDDEDKADRGGRGGRAGRGDGGGRSGRGGGGSPMV